MPSTAATRQRLEKYPERFRARVAGRVVQVTLSAPGAPPRYEAILEVEKSRPLPPMSVHALSGIPMVEVVDDLDEDAEVTADDHGVDADSTGDDSSHFPLYRVHRHEVKPAPLYPDYPPLSAGQRVHLVWHGQNTVPGIGAGTYLRCTGMLSTRQEPVRIYNPRYEIVPVRAVQPRS